MMRFSDSPSLISLDMLARLDAEPAGTYLAQAKIDGVRRQCYHDMNGGWNYQAKNKDDCKPMPPDLVEEFESLPWPLGIGLDCEMSGPRDVNGTPELWIFDLLYLDGVWTGYETFTSRRKLLYEIINPHECHRDDMWCRMRQTPRIHFLPLLRGHMVERFHEQKDNPVSEGLVIRRADSTIIGYRERSVVNPQWFKVKRESVKL